MGCETLIQVFFSMQNTIKLYHWQTGSFARHKATCELLAGLDPLIDSFIETYMGRYSRPFFSGGFDIKIKELSDQEAESILDKYIQFLKVEVPKHLKTSDTDLFNIRDEMLGILNKTVYLFTLY